MVRRQAYPLRHRVVSEAQSTAHARRPLTSTQYVPLSQSELRVQPARVQ
jgi:hypothetical protein